MSNTESMKAMLRGMGIDIDKLPAPHLERLLKVTESISKPEEITQSQVNRIQEILGLKKRQPIKSNKIPVNSKCPCGSKKKYKKCCMNKKETR